VTFRVGILGGGMAGLETAVALASHPDVYVELIERGPSQRTQHINWDHNTYPGDEKTQRWRSDGWGIGGGLNERLAGRSLCYHGVLLGIEHQALADWPQEWSTSFLGEDGYGPYCESLESEFPELREHELSSAAHDIGLTHVPQAAQLDEAGGRFRAYSPIRPALRLEARNERLTISRGAVEKLRHVNGSWAVDMYDVRGELQTRDGLDACVLAASAIANIQILSRTFGHDVETSITDHFSVGALARLAPGNELEAFRHEALWTGYLRIPELSTNVFVQEMKPLEGGHRLVKVSAVTEQGPGPADFSKLTILIQPGRTSDTYIDTRISLADRERLAQVRAKILEVTSRIAQDELEDVTGAWGGFAVPPPRGETEPGRSSAYWRSHDNALQTLMDQRTTGKLAFYDFPYGAYEHEACTHSIGGTSPVAVTTDLEVQELPGVYVVGPGSFPRMGTANPALTILVMSRFLAKKLRERHL
jgi:choline dehydrogenase-like flavoprotein